MDETKSHNNKDSMRCYWRFLIPFTTLLIVMVKFPVRIGLQEAFWDSVFYGTLSLICVATAVRAYRRFGSRSYRLAAVALLCSVLAGWQVVDMAILRVEGPFAHTFASTGGVFEPIHDGWASYNLRFPSHTIMCHILSESYIGNNVIAIAYDIRRDAAYGACGG
jgi:hypothetical protein